ncbi:MAG: acetoin dehydrogenase dihydrolipoyllysine-residue acetyltransferase subunit [Pseudomonadota bacterium]
MPVTVLYPKVSLESASGKISQWLVAEGDAVQQGQILFEIENDKAAVEVDSPGDGIIRQLAAAGTEVDVGAAVAMIYAAGEAVGTSEQIVSEKPILIANQSLDTPVPRRDTPNPTPPNPTPLARRMAADAGISLKGLPGTGPNGRVQRKDVEAHLAILSPGLNAVWLRRGEGVPLVLLHGFASDHNTWRGMFAGSPFAAPVLALDLPCHGASPRDVPADLDAVAALVEQTLTGLLQGPLVLAGHSFGGAVAARLASRGRLDLRGLCLFAPAGLGPEVNAAFTSGILRSVEPASLRPWLHELTHDPATITPAFLTAVVQQRQNQPLTAAMQAFAARFFPDGTQAASIRADLSALTLPARVVFGRQDRILPYAATRHLPGSVGLHSVDDCGHLPHLEHPALALRILTELLRA